jgi:hypothetical protein
MAAITFASLFGVMVQTGNHSSNTNSQSLRTVVIGATTLAAPNVVLENRSLTAKTGSTLAVVFSVESSLRGNFDFAISTGGSEVSPQDISSGHISLPVGVNVVFQGASLVSNVSAFQERVTIAFTGAPVGTLSLELVVYELGQAAGPVGAILPFSIQVTG